MSSHIRDINLWESGALKIQWVRDHMPLLAGIEKDFIETKPFAGMKVALSVHMEAKTARLCLCLAAGGAEMYATGCNPLSTQDDVATSTRRTSAACWRWARTSSLTTGETW